MTQTIKPLNDSRYIPTKGLCERYHVVPRTVNRWRNDPKLDFPKPMGINGRNYYDEEKQNRWDAERKKNDSGIKSIKDPAMRSLISTSNGGAI